MHPWNRLAPYDFSFQVSYIPHQSFARRCLCTVRTPPSLFPSKEPSLTAPDIILVSFTAAYTPPAPRHPPSELRLCHDVSKCWETGLDMARSASVFVEGLKYVRAASSLTFPVGFIQGVFCQSPTESGKQRRRGIRWNFRAFQATEERFKG